MPVHRRVCACVHARAHTYTRAHKHTQTHTHTCMMHAPTHTSAGTKQITRTILIKICITHRRRLDLLLVGLFYFVGGRIARHVEDLVVVVFWHGHGNRERPFRVVHLTRSKPPAGPEPPPSSGVSLKRCGATRARSCCTGARVRQLLWAASPVAVRQRGH